MEGFLMTRLNEVRFVWVGLLALAVPALAARPQPVCGDGKCNRGETAETCPVDCGGPETPPTCATLADRPAVPPDGAVLTGDGLGDYCADEPGVSVHFATNFLLGIDPKKASRHLELDLQSCPGTGQPCTLEDVLTANTSNLSEYAYDPVSEGFFVLGELDLQAMQDGEQTFAGLRINFASQSRSTPHQILFGGVGDFDCVALGGTPVSVARAGDTWVFAADPALGCQLEVENRNQHMFKGIVEATFEITVSRP